MAESKWADLGGQVHWIDYGGPADGPLLVCVHGLGGSALNWMSMAPLLTAACRVVALDLAGFGHTRGEGRSTSVAANRRLLYRFVTEVVGGPAVLVGNSMGGLISAFEAATHPRDVAGVVLIDPALPPDLRTRPDPRTLLIFGAYFTPGLGRAVIGRRQRQLTPEELAMDTLRLCCAHPDRVSPDALDVHLELVRSRSYPQLAAEFVEATRSLLRTMARRRKYAALLRRITAPVLLIHGELDRLIPVTSARAVVRAHPQWRYEEVPDVGHVPQLEAPGRVAELILDWTAREGASAVTAARRAYPRAGYPCVDASE
jgi:pimeloyl-ACP methyl ester carboxylesterase